MRECILVLGMIMALSGIAPAGENRPRAGISFPGDVEFFVAQRRGMDMGARDFEIDLITTQANWDPELQLKQFADLIAQQVDILLLCSTDNIKLMPAVEMANTANIPLITFTNVLGPNPDGSLEGVISFVSVNDITMGEIMGEMAEILLKGRETANIVLIEGAAGTSAQRMRTQGFVSILANYPGWKIVFREAIPGWTRDGALEAVQRALKNNADIDLISCHWHSAAAAAVDALTEHGLEHKILVTGLEYSREIMPLIKNATINMTSDASVVDMGYRVIETASRVLHGEKVPAVIEILPIIVDSSNVNMIEPAM